MEKICGEALEFLQGYYKDAKQYVADSKLYTDYVEEKIFHSKQVFGAMRYIMKHEKTFQNKSEYFLNCAKIATILHDVGRFEEIKNLYLIKKEKRIKKDLWNSPLNHGYYGYEILKNSAKYNDPRIYIPVKHHGNMIEELYEDEEFSSIKDESLKKDIVEIIFLVRDADKAANFYLFTNSKRSEKFPEVFKNKYSEEQNKKGITQQCLDTFTQFQLIGHECIYNYASQNMNVLSWVFDMNYLPTFDLIIKNGSLNKLADKVYAAAQDDYAQTLIENTIADYLKMRYDEKMRLL